MVSYATTDDIESEFKSIDFSSSDTSVSTPDVSGFIEQESAYITSYLQGVYNLPLTDTDGLKILKRITISLVAFRVASILDFTHSVQVSQSMTIQKIKGGAAYKQALSDLKMIKGGDLVISSTELRDNSAPASYNSEQAVDPVFSTTEQQW